MEGKEPIKVRLSTVVLLIVILILVGGMIYFIIQNNELKNTKGENTNQIEALQTQVKELENKIVEPQNPETNTIVDTNTNQNINTNTSSVTDKYEEITKKLELNDENFKEIFVVTDVEKSGDKYLLKGRVYTGYSDSINQQGISYKVTDNFKKIAVEENTRCVYTNYNGSIDEEEVLKDTTAKEYFKEFESITADPKPGELFPNYNFEFENGKCTKITIRTNYI